MARMIDGCKLLNDGVKDGVIWVGEAAMTLVWIADVTM